jgi:hypothetical protein
VGFISNWYGKCTDDSGCYPGDACVAAGGRGACAPPPDPDLGCFLNPAAVPTEVARFGTTDTVEVCATPVSDGICVDKTCQPNCGGGSGGCGTKGLTCNSGTGLCDCSESPQCSDSKTTPVCGASLHCECTTNDQCASIAGTGFDTCYSGKCGCSSADACPTPFQNAPAVCE